MPTNKISNTNQILLVVNITALLFLIFSDKIITSIKWSDEGISVGDISTMLGSLLTFLITCFIAWTGWKAYYIYIEQVQQSKVKSIIDLHIEQLKIHNELINTDDGSPDSQASYTMKLHNIFHSACSYFIYDISPKDDKLVDIFNRFFYSPIQQFVQISYWNMLNTYNISQEDIPISLSIVEFCTYFDIEIEDKRKRLKELQI